MRPVPVWLCVAFASSVCLFQAASLTSLRGENFSIDGKTVAGEIVDLVAEGVFVAVGDSGEVVPWDKLTTFQARKVRSTQASQLLNLRSQAVWIVGTVREVVAQGAIVYADARPRANYGVSLNVPDRDDNKPRPRTTRAGAAAVSGWYLVTDLPQAEALIDETIQLIAYPNGKSEEIQLAEENDAEKIPTVSLALPPWAGVRQWTNQEGNAIEAELVFVEGGQCLFEKADQTMVYPLNQLSEADQAIAGSCEALARKVFIAPSARQ